jgi:hypothetical protein
MRLKAEEQSVEPMTSQAQGVLCMQRFLPSKPQRAGEIKKDGEM